MGVLRRMLRSTFGAGFSGGFSALMFGLPLSMALWVPTTEAVELEPLPVREVSIALQAAPAPSPEPESVEEAAAPSKSSPEPVAEEPVRVRREAPTDRRQRLRDSGLARLEAKRAAATSGAGGKGTGGDGTDASSKKGKKQCELLDGLEARSSTSYDVEKALMKEYMGNLSKAAKLAVVGWAEDDSGQVIGFKLRRVRRCSPLHQAGFRSGDVITSINGREITNMSQALGAWNRLKKKKKLDVQMKRKGAQRRMIYRVV